MARIAILSDDYLPKSTRNHSKMLHELARNLIQKKHEVVVITPGTASQNKICEEIILDGVKIWLFRSNPIRVKSKVKRTINETFLSLKSFLALTTTFKDTHFHLCINYSPSIFFGPLAFWLKVRGAKVYLILRDFFPQWAIDEGLIREHSVISIYFRFFERLNYKSADFIGVQSKKNVDVFNQQNKFRYKNVEPLYNWSSGSFENIDPSFGKSLIENYKLSKKVIFFYGGNIGSAQDMDNILRLASGLKSYKNIHVLIIGQGFDFDRLKKEIKTQDLKNSTILPSVSQSEYCSVLLNIHVGVFTLAKSHSSHNFPGKILNYMAAGIPILGSVNVKNDLAPMINDSGAGLITINGDDDRFRMNAIRLASSIGERAQMGAAGKKLLIDTFSVETAAAQILSKINIKK